MRRLSVVAAVVVATAAALAAVASLGAQPAPRAAFPGLIPLPAGWQPEGIAVGRGTSFFVGSLATGAVYRGDLRTGKGAQFVLAQGMQAVGLAVDRRGRIWVAGGQSGTGSVYGPGGTLIRRYAFAPSGTFVNDVVVTSKAAWFTDSQRSQLYRVDIGVGGAPAARAAVVPLSGDYAAAQGFNVNGVDATADGKRLVIVQTATGMLYRVDAGTGTARAIVLAGRVTLPSGDGILLDGRTLYVVQNQLDKVAVVRLSSDLLRGRLIGAITDPDLDVPTTIARFGNSLYVVNARFGAPSPETAAYAVVKLPRRAP